MWKRDEAVKPTGRRPPPAAGTSAGRCDARRQRRPPAARSDESRGSRSRDVVNIGKSVVIKGELNGSEDLTIEGHVEGKIELRDHVLTIGPNGRSRQRCSRRP